MVDEQDLCKGIPPTGVPANNWTIPSQFLKTIMPASAYIDLGQERYLSAVYVYDMNGSGDIVFSSGKPGAWKEETTYDCKAYKKWAEVPLTCKTRYLRVTRKDGGSNFAEIALVEQTEKEFVAAKARKDAEDAAAAQKQAAETKSAAEKEAALAKAKDEAAKRQTVDLGDPFGKVMLVDEINVAAEDPGHLYKSDPAGASKIETILGKPCRVLAKTPGEGNAITFRVGQYKLLKPGAAYILEVEYPEDVARSTLVLNSGNESSVGFYTGAAVGDAFRPKYVGNLTESINTPLSGKYQTWTQFFNLHDRYPDTTYIRGDGERSLTADDGFTVTIAQFSAENLPVSAGAAVSRIRLYEVPDASKIDARYTLPPKDLPRRHIFWREEMADNVIAADKSGQPGVNNAIDWYRYKANQMQFLGMNTYAKDLLEFGAVQHWDSSFHGGNKWAYFNAKQAGLWNQIVELMGERKFDILPYYEYAGSKGQQGLGPERRAKPLTRDDAYTHIKWIESANADITDPDTYEDFKKMLEITIVQQKDKANFIGAWLRPRSQIPMGFGDTTRKRFADEANGGKEITRQQLKADPALLAKYEQWWFGKRKQFLVAMCDYLREKGINDATILFTAAAGEPGVPFPTWDPIMVADDVDGWKKRLEAIGNEKDAKLQVLSVKEVVAQDKYLEALLAAPKNWGDWEINHASPPSDPQNYKDVDGVMITAAINRLYTVASPKVFDTFRSPSGLALLRHYSLNENMMFDKADKPKLGYFCADVERAGPFCMMAEAVAIANGDQTYQGYLTGRTYVRGFPKYVRNFNTAFLSLPALPSQRLDNVSSDPEVVVRAIKTEKHGTYYAVVNTGMTEK
jgi:hypothetical protein